MKRCLLAVVLLSLIAVPPAQACLDLPPDPPDIWVMGDPCVEDLLVVLHDYTTFAEGPGAACGCALNLPLTFGEVTGAEIVFAGTDIPVPGFPFVSNPNVGDGFDTLEPGDWTGFSADVDAVVAAGIQVDLRFRVNARKPQQCDFLVDEVVDVLSSEEFVVGTAGLDDNDFPVTHVGIGKPGEIAVADVNGKVDQMTLLGFRCTNQTTGQVLQTFVEPGESMWDCGSLGFESKPGDRVLITLLGDR